MSNQSKPIQVPRVFDVTGKFTVEQVKASKESNKAKRAFIEDKRQAKAIREAEREAWLRRIQRTRSF